jgi:outer membrane protein assembly factor BamB
LNALPAFQQPYHLRVESGKYIQQAPSLGVLPSLAASQILSDLRPKSIQPPLRWEYGLPSRILYPLTLTPTRAWAVTEGNVVLALNKNTHAGKVVIEAREHLAHAIPAAPSQSGTTNFIPFGNGTMVAIDATSGSLTGGLNIRWRADTGGINNRSPFVTKNFIYASGDDSGVACVSREHGELVWRSEDNADRIIGANEEFVYIRDRQGRFLVFDAKRATDPARKKSVALGAIDLSEFNVNIVNTASDRIYLAADNGLIVCLRDASPKYVRPIRIWPAPDVNTPKRVGVESQLGRSDMETNPKEPDKKEPEKKP